MRTSPHRKTPPPAGTTTTTARSPPAELSLPPPPQPASRFTAAADGSVAAAARCRGGDNRFGAATARGLSDNDPAATSPAAMHYPPTAAACTVTKPQPVTADSSDVAGAAGAAPAVGTDQAPSVIVDTPATPPPSLVAPVSAVGARAVPPQDVGKRTEGCNTPSAEYNTSTQTVG